MAERSMMSEMQKGSLSSKPEKKIIKKKKSVFKILCNEPRSLFLNSLYKVFRFIFFFPQKDTAYFTLDAHSGHRMVVLCP